MAQDRQAKAAKKFMESWAGHGYEKGESQKFWIDLLTNVFGVTDISSFIFFEEQVKEKLFSDSGKEKTITNFIDAYIPSTRVMIEQKSSSKDLRERIKQSDGTFLTPFQQAKKYVADLPLSQHPKWIVTCNFDEFLVYDMENPNGEPKEILLNELDKNLNSLQFLVDKRRQEFIREEEISLKAGELVGKLYDALEKEYVEPTDESFRSLNILCVRLVFCLYAEDAGLFETKTSFVDYVKSFNLPNLRNGIINLFKALDTKICDRDKYDLSLKPFPYVNGGLFRDEKIEIPNFTEEIVDVIVNHCAPFNWSEISPTIFGAVFESTLNPETRRKGGMHYTSIENIHKVIDPLFLDDLNAEFEKCKSLPKKERKSALHKLQEKLGSLKFLDPACGSGNFLTETYLSLRRLENKVLSLWDEGERKFSFDEYILVKISQFYGIEINDFAVTVAKTALWIAESQMILETEAILAQKIEFLPLKTNAFIVEGNALRMDWATLTSTSLGNRSPIGAEGNTLDLFFGFTTHVDGTVHEYDYIMGNPPFVGARLMSDEQKKDVLDVFGNIKNVGNLDYVSCWYKKAADLIKGKKTKAALVSTNSITQGEQVAILWKTLFENDGVQIDFAWRTFRWDSESTEKAHVHCVIVGFSCHTDSILLTQNQDKTNNGKSLDFPNPCDNIKKIYNPDGTFVEAKNINGYLLDAPNIFVESRSKPLCTVPEIGIGNLPIDGGNYLFTENEMKDFIRKEPTSEKYFHKWIGSDEFINRYYRYCLWLGDCSPAEIKKMPECYKRVQAVREFRQASKRGATQKLADIPTHFSTENMPKSDFIIVPKVSSEKRFYIPIGFLTPDIFASDLVFIIPDASLYHFGVLTSSVHNAWVRAVCGRLKSDYRYSKDIVYNNFPWPNPTDEQEAKIEATAQAILDARAKYPDSSLADLYDETLMPADLRKAHRENDNAVMEAYEFDAKMTEAEIVAKLFAMYEELSGSY
ncbi:MAG: class I SAM-dependent DNA methyltransferase [Treponema sp.]|nr:class I SAM-dependent DNA methyltransferase [Treponema sp.]